MRIRVYADWANVETDQPLRHDPPAHALHLLAMGRAVVAGSRAIRLLPVSTKLSPELVACAGYDVAAHSGRAKFFLEVWQRRRSGGIEMFQMIPASRKVTPL